MARLQSTWVKWQALWTWHLEHQLRAVTIVHHFAYIYIYIYRVADRRNLVWWTSAENYLQDSAAPKNHVIIVSYFGPLTKNMKPKYWQSIIIFVILIYSYMYFIPSWKSKLFKPDYFWIWLSEKNFRFIGSLFTWWNACRKKTKV